MFGVPEAYAAPDVLLATYAYAAQIYCDFSGYTDMAIGLALLLGFIFPQNFNSPYRATGFRDFWRRWHMTLSRFLRDYLYIPLGGSRGEPAVHLPQPDDHDGARRALARRRLDLRALGGVPRRRTLVTEHALDGRIGRRTPAWLRWFVHLQPRLLRLDPVPLARPRPVLGPSSAASSTRGPATLWTVPVVLAMVVVIGLQLLPPRPLERLQLRIERLRPIAPRRRPRGDDPVVGATVPSQGVPPFIYFQF